jgi:hypothetical protein
MNPSDDLVPSAMPGKGAPEAGDPQALEDLVAEASSRATEAIKWYLSAKEKKRIWA